MTKINFHGQEFNREDLVAILGEMRKDEALILQLLEADDSSLEEQDGQ